MFDTGALAPPEILLLGLKREPTMLVQGTRKGLALAGEEPQPWPLDRARSGGSFQNFATPT